MVSNVIFNDHYLSTQKMGDAFEYIELRNAFRDGSLSTVIPTIILTGMITGGGNFGGTFRVGTPFLATTSSSSTCRAWTIFLSASPPAVPGGRFPTFIITNLLHAENIQNPPAFSR